jgi:hypothetical protein
MTDTRPVRDQAEQIAALAASTHLSVDEALRVTGVLAERDALRAENARLRAVQQAIRECRDDPAKAIVEADRIAGEHIIRADALRATVDRVRAALDAVDECPTPVYHQTHRYCPSCPWTERDEDA